MKKKLRLTLTCLLVSLFLSCASSAASLIGFQDVAPGFWGYDAIMEMAQLGLISGTTQPDANGIGTFSPDSTMNRSHFLSIVGHYLYDEELSAMQPGAVWYSNAYDLLVSHDILTAEDFEGGVLDVPMSRQEMAYVLVQAAAAQNKQPKTLVAPSDIPDWERIDPRYQSSVQKVYSMGMITGTDDAGTFSPTNTLSRAQASVVISRLVNFGCPKMETRYVLSRSVNADNFYGDSVDTYTYDERGNLVGKIIDYAPDVSVADSTYSYEYYEDGTLRSEVHYKSGISNPVEVHLYAQDGQLLKEHICSLLDGTFLHEYIHVYDDAGNKLQTIFTQHDETEVTEYIYDTTGKLIREVETREEGVFTVEYAYRDDGSLLKQTGFRPDGTHYFIKEFHENGKLWMESSYDEYGQLYKTDEFLYDGSVNLLKEVHRISYNRVNFITSVREYTYDGKGNQLTFCAYDPDNPRDKSSGKDTYDSAGRLIKSTFYNAEGIQIGAHTYSYDAKGSLIEEMTGSSMPSRKTYSYDANGNLLTESCFDGIYENGEKPYLVITNTYDAWGNRLSHRFDNVLSGWKTYSEATYIAIKVPIFQ